VTPRSYRDVGETPPSLKVHEDLPPVFPPPLSPYPEEVWCIIPILSLAPPFSSDFLPELVAAFLSQPFHVDGFFLFLLFSTPPSTKGIFRGVLDSALFPNLFFWANNCSLPPKGARFLVNGVRSGCLEDSSDPFFFHVSGIGHLVKQSGRASLRGGKFFCVPF